MADGLVTPPALLLCPPQGTDPGILPGPLAIYHDTQPDHDWFAERAPMRDAIEGPAECVVVSVPRDRVAARDRIARAARLGRPMLVDGQKTDGIDGLMREMRGRAAVGAVIAKAHGKLFAVEPLGASGSLEDWIAAPTRGAEGLLAPPGGFSREGVDAGSALLIGALPPLTGRVVDLGAGSGALARAVLASDAVETCDLVEAHRPSLDCARANVTDPRARFHWADAAQWRPAAGADHVVTNPPFHRGRRSDPDLGRAFLATAAAALAPRGTLWLVANRHLPYEAALGALFAEIEELPGSAAFKVYRAARPRRR